MGWGEPVLGMPASLLTSLWPMGSNPLFSLDLSFPVCAMG